MAFDGQFSKKAAEKTAKEIFKNKLKAAHRRLKMKKVLSSATLSN